MRPTVKQSKLIAGLAVLFSLAYGVWRYVEHRQSIPASPSKISVSAPASQQQPAEKTTPSAEPSTTTTDSAARESDIAVSLSRKTRAVFRPGDQPLYQLDDKEREEQEERAREHGRGDDKDAYDEPEIAAREYKQRRLAEGETDISIERYLNALELMRDLPRYATRTRTYLPSLRQALSNGESSAALKAAPDALSTWRLLGPTNIAGRTRALLVHPRTPEVLYAAAASGGVWKSVDGGQNWIPLADLLPNLAFNALAFDPVNPETIYAGTGEGYFNEDARRGAGIFRTFDGGASWQRLSGTNTPDFYFVNDIVVSPTNRNRLYAATRQGVFRSLDGGVTWTRVLDPAVNGGCLDLAMRTDRPTDVVFAACGSAVSTSNPTSVQASIYRNLNAGALGTWEEVYSEGGMARTSLAISPSNQNVIYAASAESGATGAPHSLHAVFRSVDGGDTWNARVRGDDPRKLNTMLFTNPAYALNNECNGNPNQTQFIHQGWYNNVIAVDPLNENIVWVGGVDWFRSEDGGANWGMASFWHILQRERQYVHADQHALVFHPQYDGAGNQIMFVSNDGGVFRTDTARGQTAKGDRAPCTWTTSGIFWKPVNNGYATTQFYHGAVFPGGRAYLGGAQDNGVLIGSDERGPNGWTEILSGDGGNVEVDPNNANVIYAETSWLSLKKSVDGGKVFKDAKSGINLGSFKFITPFVLDQQDARRLWLGGTYLWRSTNGATTWGQASSALNGITTALATSSANGNFVLAGTDTGYIYRTTTGLNTDGDTAWLSVRPRTGTVSWLAFEPGNTDVAYATYSNFGGNHVYRSQNGGANWTQIDGTGAGKLPDVPVNCLVVDPTNLQRLYIGTDVGVFTSPDGGVTWLIENTGFANVPVESLTIGHVGGIAHLFAFTHGRGVWRVPLGESCFVTVSSLGQTFGSAGGDGRLSVTMSNTGCNWTSESSVDWISIMGSPFGQGTATLTFNVKRNVSVKPRKGMITVAGQQVSVTQDGQVVNVSAATLLEGKLAPESIATVYGAGFAKVVQSGSGATLPTEIAGTVVTVTDSAKVARRAPLFFVSPDQINYLIPRETATGLAQIRVTNSAGDGFDSMVQIAPVAPGFFTASASGSGLAVGQVLRVKANGNQVYEPLVKWSSELNSLIPVPIDLGPDLGASSDRVFLILYGTGLRFSRTGADVRVRLGTSFLPVLFNGAQGSFAGLDQVNIQLTREYAGRGDVELVLLIDDQVSNTVRVSIK